MHSSWAQPSDAESPCIQRCAALQLTKLSNDNWEAVTVGGVSSGAVALDVKVAPSLGQTGVQLCPQVSACGQADGGAIDVG